MMKKAIFTLIFISLFVGVVNAASVSTATFTTYYTNDGTIANPTWVTYETNSLEVGESITSLNDIKLKEISNDGEKAIFVIDDEIAIMLKGETLIYDDFKIKLVDISYYGKSSTTEIANDNDDVISVWIEPSNGNKLYLAKNGANTFDVNKYGSSTGWSTVFEDNEIVLKAKRIQDVPITFKMESKDGSYTKESVKDNILIYTLQKNGDYTFTIEYECKSAWGGSEDKTEIYKIKVVNLDKAKTTSSSNNSNDETDEAKQLFNKRYSITQKSTRTITTTVDGEFTTNGGITIDDKRVNDDGSVDWIFNAGNYIGTYECKFTEKNGNDYGKITFTVEEDVTNTNTNTNTNTADQSYEDEDENSSLGLILAAIGLLLIIFIVINNKKKKGGNGKNQIIDEGDAIGAGGL